MKRRKPSGGGKRLPTDRPILSIGMIVKDEMRCLQRCLDALQPLRDAVPCELVIADTGSTDGTRELAAQYADVLFDFPWINDFSAARNAVMERCSGVWYLSVDADEYLDENMEELVAVMRDAYSLQFDICTVVIRNYLTNDWERGGYSDFSAVRVYRMDTGVRYSGAVHESVELEGQVTVYELSQTLFHHDGYSQNLDPKRKKEKTKRNLDLLREALEQEPEDLRRFVQCFESTPSSDWEAKGEYIVRGMDIVKNNPQKTKDAFFPSLWRYSIEWAVVNKLPEFEEWLKLGEDDPKLEKDFHSRVDVAFAVAKYAYDKKDYERVVKYAERYISGVEDYLAKNYDIAEILHLVLERAKKTDKMQVCSMKSVAHMKLGQPDKALATIADIELDYQGLTANTAKNYLLAVGHIYDQDGVPELVQSLYTAIADLPEDEPETERVKATCRHVANVAFGQNGRGRHRMFGLVGGDLARAATMMEEDQSAETLSALAIEVESWDDLPVGALYRLLQAGTKLPDPFYRRSGQKLREVAALLAQQRGMLSMLPAIADGDEFLSSVYKKQFLFEFGHAVLAMASWAEDEKKQDDPWKDDEDNDNVIYLPANEGDAPAVYEVFVSAARAFLPSYYAQSLIESPEDWSALPAIHNAALVLLDAQNMKEQGDLVGYARTLRQALKLDGTLKEIVRLLQEELKQKAETPPPSAELVALAEKVRAILSQFPADHPAVMTLRQSDAYKQVAHIIEDR